MLTQKSRYALRALMHLAAESNGKPVQIVEIAEAQRVPRKFLELIMLELKKAGLVTSQRGRGGGYVLERSPHSINFGEVIRLMDGPLALVPCASVNFYQRCGDCHDEETCFIRKVMARVRDDTARVLEATTLAEAVATEQRTAA